MLAVAFDCPSLSSEGLTLHCQLTAQCLRTRTLCSTRKLTEMLQNVASSLYTLQLSAVPSGSIDFFFLNMWVLLCAVPCYIARSPGALLCMSDGYNRVGQVGVVMFFVCNNELRYAAVRLTYTTNQCLCIDSQLVSHCRGLSLGLQ